MDVNAINKARAENVSAGLPATSGAGATITNPAPTTQPTFDSTQVNSFTKNYQSQNPSSIGGAITASGIVSQNGTSPITSNSLQQTNPVSLPSPYYSTTPDALLGKIDGTKQASLTAIADQKAQEAKLASTGAQDTYKSLVDQIAGVQANQAQMEADAKLPEKQQNITNLTNQIEADQRAQQNEIKAIQSNGSISQEAQQGLIFNINQKHASYQADLGISLSAANRDYATAQSIIEYKMALLTEPLKTRLDYAKTFYQENKADLTKAEDRQFQNLITQSQREYDTQKELLTNIGKVQLAAAQNGAPLSTLNSISQSKTLSEAISNAGNYAVDMKQKLEIEKLQNEVNAGKPITGEWADVINGASGLVTNTKKQTVKTNISNAIANGDYQTAYAEVANAVSDGLTGSNKTKFDDSRTDIGVMQGMRDAIKAYTDAGGDLGYLKGSADTIAKKFGQLAVDPKFATLGVQLQREFQSYRLSMTGAAFSPQESKEYEAVNPRTSASLDLNLATIDGALAQLKNRVNSTIQARVPSASKITDLINSQDPSNIKNELDNVDLSTSKASESPTNFWSNAPTIKITSP